MSQARLGKEINEYLPVMGVIGVAPPLVSNRRRTHYPSWPSRQTCRRVKVDMASAVRSLRSGVDA